MPNRNGRGQIGRSVRLGVRKQGNKECTCPECGYKEAYTRGIPCTQRKCPKCGTPMKGIFCS